MDFRLFLEGSVFSVASLRWTAETFLAKVLAAAIEARLPSENFLVVLGSLDMLW